MFCLAVRQAKDSTSSEQTGAAELLRAAGRVCVVQSITPGKPSLDSTEQLPSGSHIAVMVIN